jgi:ATP-dependent phosphofructokinase / diphosphate-dependent phosphofructokinase
MNELANGAIVIHGGGPTAVLNASLVGIIDACRASRQIRRLYGARQGIQGLLRHDWIDLGSLSPEVLDQIRRAPGSVLGSTRKPFETAHLAPALARCQEQGIGVVFLTGGNGTMQAAALLHQTGAVTVIGVPKTVDNDLLGTHHSPGFGSAARFYAHAVRDIGADNRALPSPVTIVEVIGRNAGWVVGATALARSHPDDAPHLIYFPECPPTLLQICDDVQRVYQRLGRVVIAVCEGLRDPQGNPFGADLDRPGNRQQELASNLAHTLARAISQATGLRVRSEKPGLLGRSCSFAVSAADALASYRCGFDAVQAAESGESGVMIALTADSETVTVPLNTVAGAERLVPRHWIAPAGNDATPELLRYIAPLAGPIEPLPVL